MEVTQRSRNSCTACQRLKRKCSKDVPTCSLCRRVGRECRYAPSGSPRLRPRTGTLTNERATTPCETPTRPASANTRPSRQLAPTPLSSAPPQTPEANRLQAWFLDSVFSRATRTSLTHSLLWTDIAGAHSHLDVLEARITAQRYFGSVHSWLPIVSMRRIFLFLDSVSFLTFAHDAALFSAMRLLLYTHDPEHSPDSEWTTYRSVKLALAECQSAGELSTNFLAVQVMTAVYEVSNAIFPDAYYTVRACYHTCCTLGIHNKRVATQLGTRPGTWCEVEERRRLWWATLILDRYLNIGFLFRPLAHPTIDSSELLPAQDGEWDRGTLSPNPLLVMSLESQTSVSAYARTCQAAHLLGRTCQHINEHVEPSDSEFHLEEAGSLQQALQALLLLLRQEVSTTDHQHNLFAALGLCFSALLTLANIHSCIDDDYVSPGTHQSRARDKAMRIELQERSIKSFRSLTADVLDFVIVIQTALDLHGPRAISPFVLHSLYQAGKAFAWYAREAGDQHHFVSLARIRELLDALRPTWRVAAHYLQLLQDTEFSYTGTCPI